jgi:hypothetical protein
VDAERLAAYLAGELDADESAALAAAIARDPRLRAELDAMQRADAALGSLAPTGLPDGFESRLRAAVDTELSTILRPHGAEVEAPVEAAAVEDGTTTHRWTDQLAARRARRARSWVPAFAGAAATVAAIAVVGIGVGVLGGGGDMDDAAGDMEMTLDADDADGSEEVGMMAAPGPGEGPTVISQGRDVDDDLADELLASIELEAVTDLALDADEGGSFGARWRDALADFNTVVGDTAAGDADVAEDAEDAPQMESDEDTAATSDRSFVEDVTVRLFADAPPSDEELAAADRCLAEVLAAGTEAIPVYLELATYQGEAAVVVGLVTFDPATDAFTRPEVWVLAREDCQVRRFSQG